MQIHSLFLCPRCNETITTIKTTIACPNCGLPLGKQEVAPYTPPYTLTEQHEKYLDSRLYVETLMDLPIHKANSIMNDALSLIEIIAGKNTPTADIRNVVGMAIKIGEIAKAYDQFLTVGGKHVPSFFQTQTTPSALGDSDVQPTTPGSGQITSPSPSDDASVRMAEVYGGRDRN